MIKHLAIVIVLALIVVLAVWKAPPRVADGNITKLSSVEDIQRYLSTSTQRYIGIEKNTLGAPVPSLAGAADGQTVQYSTTNVQVVGVDEPDIVKNDGKYIYTVSEGSINIIEAYPAQDARLISRIEGNDTISEIFLDGNKLIVFGSLWYQPSYDDPVLLKADARIAMPIWWQPGKTFVRVYDVSVHDSPVMEREVIIDGYYVDARLINHQVYAIVNTPIYGENITLPVVQDGGEVVKGFPDVYAFPGPFWGGQFTTLFSLNTVSPGIEQTVYLTGGTDTIYVSNNNLYIAYQKRVDSAPFYQRITDEAYLPLLTTEEKLNLPTTDREYAITSILYQDAERLKEAEKRAQPILEELGRESEKTVIQRISLKDGSINYESTGEVPGTLLNQFSLDEYADHLRVATTTHNWAVRDGKPENHVFVLNNNLEVTGSIEGIAKGETIYAVRFMGNRGYVVTFQRIDPLFVLNLADPSNPTIAGELKIPGFSDYLHPYDETHLIGIGKEAVEGDEFGWYQGVKIALFDISDITQPKEVSHYTIGDRGTDSEALYDHKAFLFSPEKQIIVLPITLAKIDTSQYPNGVPPSAYGTYEWQGAYVFATSPEGFTLKGQISHGKDVWGPTVIRRSLYIDNTLYTISEGTVKANDIETLQEVAAVQLPVRQQPPILYYAADTGGSVGVGIATPATEPAPPAEVLVRA